MRSSGWQYAPSDSKTPARLRSATVYMVGHHGRTNATPQRLWKVFRHRGAKRQRLMTLLSTKKGGHQGVPRPPLVGALQNGLDLHSTAVSWS